MNLTLLKSKLVWGSILAAGAWLLSQPTIGIVEVVQALGGVIAAAGTRDAIRKSAPTNSVDGAKAAAEGEVSR